MMMPLNSLMNFEIPTGGRIRLARSKPAPFSLPIGSPPAHKSSSASSSVHNHGLNSQMRSNSSPPSPLLALALRKPQSSYLARYEALNQMKQVKKMEEDKIRERTKSRESRDNQNSNSKLNLNNNNYRTIPGKIPLQNNKTNSAKSPLIQTPCKFPPGKHENKNIVKSRMTSSAETTPKKPSKSFTPAPPKVPQNKSSKKTAGVPILEPTQKPSSSFSNQNNNENDNNNEIESKPSEIPALKRSCSKLELELNVSTEPPAKREKTEIGLKPQSKMTLASATATSTTDINSCPQTDSQITTTLTEKQVQVDEPQQTDLDIFKQIESDHQTEANFEANVEDFEKLANEIGPEPTKKETTLNNKNDTEIQNEKQTTNNNNNNNQVFINKSELACQERVISSSAQENDLDPEKQSLTLIFGNLTTSGFESKSEQLSQPILENGKESLKVEDEMKSQIQEEKSNTKIPDQLFSNNKKESTRNFSENEQFKLTQFQHVDIEISQNFGNPADELYLKSEKISQELPKLEIDLEFEPEKLMDCQELGNGENPQNPQNPLILTQEPKKVKRKKHGAGKTRRPKEISENSSSITNEQLNRNCKNPDTPKKTRNGKSVKRIRNKLNQENEQSDKKWLPLTKNDIKRREFLKPMEESAKQHVLDNRPAETEDKQLTSFSKVPLFYDAAGHLEAILRITNVSTQFLCFRVSSCAGVGDRYKIDPKEGHLAPGDFLPVTITTKTLFDQDEIKQDVFKIETILSFPGATCAAANQRIWKNTPESKVGVAHTRSILLYSPNDAFFLDCLFGDLCAPGDGKCGKIRNGRGKTKIRMNVADVLEEIQVAQRKIQRLRVYAIFHHIWLCALIFCGAVLIYRITWQNLI